MALVAGLAACAPAQPEAADSATPTPSASPAATESATPTPTPWDPNAAATWSAEAFPISGTDQYVVYTSGQLAAARDAGSSMTSYGTETGSYELQAACQGGEESSVTIDVTAPGGASARVTAPCDEVVVTTPFILAGPDVTVAVSGAGADHVVWTAVLATTPLR